MVLYVKNKNRSYQGVNRADLMKLILDILKVRQHINRKSGGCSYQKLSEPAKMALGRSFWRRWNEKHADICMKRQGIFLIRRALNCTKAKAISHLDAVADELQQADIFRNAVNCHMRTSMASLLKIICI